MGSETNAFLKFSEYEILTNAGRISHEVAATLALKEYEDYRKIQDKNYVSDFDLEVRKLLKVNKHKKSKNDFYLLTPLYVKRTWIMATIAMVLSFGIATRLTRKRRADNRRLIQALSASKKIDGVSMTAAEIAWCPLQLFLKP